MNWYVDCANCGRQVKISGPEDGCYFCGKSATKKGVIVERKEQTAERPAVPPRPKKRKKLQEYLEQHKEAIVADYQSMKRLDFLKRWGISTEGWKKLRALWAVPLKQPGRANTATAKGPKKETSPKSDVELLAEKSLEIAYLRGYQQAAQDFFVKAN